MALKQFYACEACYSCGIQLTTTRAHCQPSRVSQEISIQLISFNVSHPCGTHQTNIHAHYFETIHSYIQSSCTWTLDITALTRQTLFHKYCTWTLQYSYLKIVLIPTIPNPLPPTPYQFRNFYRYFCTSSKWYGSVFL